MKAYACILILSLILMGCGWRYREYELNENSFGIDTMVEIEKESGIELPDGAKGLKYHYIPPIDPIVFAKIKIPVETGTLMESRIAALKDMPSYPKNFANERCQWWPSDITNAIMARKAFSNGYYIEAYLVQEKEQLILYLKYYTI